MPYGKQFRKQESRWIQSALSNLTTFRTLPDLSQLKSFVCQRNTGIVNGFTSDSISKELSLVQWSLDPAGSVAWDCSAHFPNPASATVVPFLPEPLAKMATISG